MRKSTAALWQLFQKSGIDGGPVITDEEVKELIWRLEDMREYLAKTNPQNLGFINNIISLEHVLFARTNR